MRNGQQVVVTDATAYSRLGVQKPTGVTAWDGDPHVIIGGRQTLLDISGGYDHDGEH